MILTSANAFKFLSSIRPSKTWHETSYHFNIFFSTHQAISKHWDLVLVVAYRRCWGDLLFSHCSLYYCEWLRQSHPPPVYWHHSWRNLSLSTEKIYYSAWLDDDLARLRDGGLCIQTCEKAIKMIQYCSEGQESSCVWQECLKAKVQIIIQIWADVYCWIRRHFCSNPLIALTQGELFKTCYYSLLLFIYNRGVINYLKHFII